MTEPHPSQARAFEWDEHNEDKLGERNILPTDVEYVWSNNPQYRRNKKSGTARWLMEGQDRSGRTLRIGILWADAETRVLRAITAWPI